MFASKKKLAAALAALTLLTASACAQETTTGTETSGGGGDCSAYETYGDLSGKTISVYTSIVSPEDQPHIDSFKKFEECTGAKIDYEGSREFEKQLPIKIESGSAPDIAYVPQPGLVKTLVEKFPDAAKPVSEAAIKNVDEHYDPLWKKLGSVGDKFVAVPVGANVKSFVWYSPKVFQEKGYEVPTTWEELIALTDEMVAENPDVKPWCAGIESGPATGWPATDWLEDMMLRTVTPEEYDQWVEHKMPFNDPKVVEALDKAGSILKNDKYVNGGFDDVRSIATTPFADAGQPIVEGECFLHRQASFYQANWPEGTEVGEEGDVYAFYLPGESADTKPLLIGGEFAMAFADRPEVQAFQAYLTSPEWSNEKAKATPGGWLSANKKLDPNNLKAPIDKLSFELLTDEASQLRFDGSDLMPGNVGAGSFWKEMTNWIASDKPTKDVLDAIEKSWTDK